MLMTRLPFTKTTALLLPIVFLWLFIACVSICSRESEEDHAHRAALLSTEMKPAPDCAGCPVAAFPSATIPDRARFDFELQTTPVGLPQVLFVAPMVIDSVAQQRQQSNTDPPLKPLHALRI
jgi:hypothetical protein